MVYANQAGYYRAINQSADAAGCGIFVDFMLEEILNTLKKYQSVGNAGTNAGASVGVNVLEYIRLNPGCRGNAIAQALGMTMRTVERHIKLLREQQKIEFRGAPKNGGYYLTAV